jgi:hypothetical protein
MRKDVLDVMPELKWRRIVLLEKGKSPVYGVLMSKSLEGEIRIETERITWEGHITLDMIVLLEISPAGGAEPERFELSGPLPRDALTVGVSDRSEEGAEWGVGYQQEFGDNSLYYVLVNGKVDAANPPRPFKDALRGRTTIGFDLGNEIDGLLNSYLSESPFGLDLVVGSESENIPLDPFDVARVYTEVRGAGDLQHGDAVLINIDDRWLEVMVEKVDGALLTLIDGENHLFMIHLGEASTPEIRQVLMYRGLDESE